MAEQEQPKEQQPQVQDEFELSDLPEVPTLAPDKEPPEVKDEFESAVQYSFLGIGHGGSRIVESFWKLGYRRVCVVNTAKQDLDKINLPEERKKWLGVGGAAKNRRIGSDAIRSNSEDIMDLMRHSYGTKFDRILVCCTAGGGTGSGGFEPAIQLANDLVEERRLKKVGELTRVGLLIALPGNSERDRMSNAWEALKSIQLLMGNKLISPVILVDNERINTIFRSATVGNVWEIANQSITSMFHLFNRIAVSPTRYTPFDPADYRSILDSGLVTYGTLPIAATDKDSLAKAFRENLTKNVLTGGMTLKNAKLAACLLLGDRSTIEAIPNENVDHAYEVLGRVVGSASVHRGIYSAKRSLSAFTLIGGLEMPKERLDEISRLSGHRDWDE